MSTPSVSTRRRTIPLGRVRGTRASALMRWTTPAIIVLALAAVILAVSAYFQESSSRAEEARLLARAAALDVDRYLQSQLGTLAGIAASDPVVAGDETRMRAYFDRIDPASIGFDGQLFWVDRNGAMRARSGYTGPALDFSDREWVERVLNLGSRYVSNARVGQLNAAPIVVLAVPTFDATGALSGVLGGAMRLGTASSGETSLTYAGGTPVEIADRVGQVIAGPRPIRDLATIAPSFPFAELRADEEGAVVGGVGPTGDTGRLVGYAAVPTADWLVVVDEDLTAVLRPARDRLVLQLALVGLITVLAVAAAGWATSRIASSMRQQEAAYAAEHEARARLEEAVGRLREREELREAFVGVLSHELRTPVTTIYGMANLLVRSPDRADRASVMEDIRDESDRLYRIVEDLLVLSRAERGVLAMALEPVLVQRLIPAIVADLQRRFPHITLTVDVPPYLRPVAGEEGPLRQIIGNFLTNAAKYGAGTPVRLFARELGERIEIRVEDGGPGFPADEAERLFELFYRSPHTARHAAGTGIGLYVTRQLAEAMGGQVTASRRPEGGAVFTLSLAIYPQVVESDGEHAARGSAAAG